MADPTGFKKYPRTLPSKRPIAERIEDYRELYQPVSETDTQEQAARCMDCGIPFCHNGCPLGNVIPDFNDAVYAQNWKEAFTILSQTNNFPEFTGRICPAPCEAACVLNLHQAPVTIEQIEQQIAEVAFQRGYVRPQPPATRTGKQVAVIGSGPAGLAAAAQLNRAGHRVTVFERNDQIGGLLRYGIPDFKLEKWIIDRRLALLEAEGIRFQTNAHVGQNIDPQQLLRDFDALLLCGGSTVPRDIPQPGRDLQGIHFAMDFLEQSNRRVSGLSVDAQTAIVAAGKHVVVIGGGDTGADCVGTSIRQQAASVTQIEIMGKPSEAADPNVWPNWPMVLRTSTSHEEGCEREWALLTKAFLGNEHGQIRAIETVRVEWGREGLRELSGQKQEWPCDLLLIAAGFLHPERKGLLEILGVELTERGNVAAAETNYQTNVAKVFAAGDMRRGQSLVVWAISEGREAARSVDTFLRGEPSTLASKEALSLGI